MGLRCLLRPPPWCEPAANPAAASKRGGAALARRLSAPPRPFGENQRLCRFYSSKEGVGGAEAAAVGTGGGSRSREQELARLGEREQQEWLSGERFLTGCKRRESPFLAVYWVDTQDIEHDHDTQAEDWHTAIEALGEVLSSLQPAIVYFPDSSQWLSRAVPKSNCREFVEKIEEMLDQLTGPLVLICGQNIAEASTKTLLFHNMARLSHLTSSLKWLVGGLKGRKPSRSSDITKLFKNRLFIPLPKDDEQMRVFNNQIEVDKK